MRYLSRHFGLSVLLVSSLTVSAMATVSDFEGQAANRGSKLGGIPDLPRTSGIATFTGGELHHAAVRPNSDLTGIYARKKLFGSGEMNPIIIAFAPPINQFSVFPVNAHGAAKHAVSNNGGSVTIPSISMDGLGAVILSLVGNIINSVDVMSANSDSRNLAIDNLTFTSPHSAPEPNSTLLIAAGFVFLGYHRCPK